MSFPQVCDPLDYAKILRPPELLVSGAPANSIVFVLPDDGQSMNPLGVLSDGAGTAWFYLKEPGKYRIMAGDQQTKCEVKSTFYSDKPGYAHINRVNLAPK